MTLCAVAGAAGCGKAVWLIGALGKALADPPLREGQRVLALTAAAVARQTVWLRGRTRPPALRDDRQLCTAAGRSPAVLSTTRSPVLAAGAWWSRKTRKYWLRRHSSRRTKPARRIQRRTDGDSFCYGNSVRGSGLGGNSLRQSSSTNVWLSTLHTSRQPFRSPPILPTILPPIGRKDVPGRGGIHSPN